MMRVDTAIRAKIMFRRKSVELVQLKMLGPLDDAQANQRYGCNDSAFAPANGAVATPRVGDAVGEIQLQLHQAAMARGPMFWPYADPAYFFELEQFRYLN